MVTQPSNPNAGFSNFLEEYQRNNPVSLDPSRLPSVSGRTEGEKLGFLGRAIDIISRPMRLISNPAMKLVGLPERFDKAQELRLSGDTSGAFKESVSAFTELAFAPVTGFFSDDPKNKPYWSDIIEKGVDVANRNDPNYVDTANNVNPVLKGTLGFVGDFVLDPLWLVPGLGWGAKLAKTGAKGTKTINEVAQANAAISAGRQTEEVFTLATRRAGQDPAPLREFRSLDEAQAALAAEQSKGGSRARPWVNVDEIQGAPGRNTNSFRIERSVREVPVTPVTASGAVSTAAAKSAKLPDNVPASSISDRLTRELLDESNVLKTGQSSSEFLATTVGKILNDAAKAPGGQNPLAEFLTSLAKSAAPPVKAAGKPASFNNWLSSLGKDRSSVDSVVQMPNSLTLRGVFGERASMGYILKTYRDTKNTEIKDAIRSLILEPAYGKYSAGVKAGKAVDSLGRAASSAAVAREVAEANSASRLINTLAKLDDANAARLGELMGDEFVALLRKSDPTAIAQFLDDFKMILLKTGTLESLGRATPDSLLGAALARFDVDPTSLSRAVSLINQRIADIPSNPPQSLAKAAENVADDPGFQSSIRRVLEGLGYPAEALDRAVVAGRSIKGIYESVLAIAASALKRPIENKLSKPYQDKNYPHEYAGVRKSDPEFLEGVGVIPLEPATYFQFDLFLAVAKDGVQPLLVGKKRLRVFSDASGNQFKGTKLAAEKERLSIATLKVLEDFLIERGLPLTFDYQGVFHNMRFTQAYEQIASVAGDNFARFIFFNANTGVAPTQFMEAIAKSLSGGSRAEVREILTSAVDRNGKPIVASGGRNINFLAETNKKGVMGNFSKTGNETADAITDAIMESVPALKAISRSNAEDYLARAGTEARVISQDAADYLVGLINSPDKLAEALRATANSERVVGDFARTINATELGAATANAVVKAGIGSPLKNNAQELVNLERATVSGYPKRVEKARKEMLDSAEEFQARVRREAEEIVEEVVSGTRQLDNVPPGVVDDVVQSATATDLDKIATSGFGTVQAFLMKVLDPLNKAFNMKAGMHANEMPWGHRLFAASANHLHNLAAKMFQPLRAIVKNNDFMQPVTPGSKISVASQAMKNIQKGVVSNEGTVMRQAEDALRPLVSRFFDTSNEVFNALLGNAFFRTGAGIDAINDALAVNKVLGNKTPPTGIYFDRNLAEQTVQTRIAREVSEQRMPLRKASDEEIMQEMFNQWRTWDIDDPVQFMSQLHRAVIQTSVESGFSTLFWQKALQTGVGSTKPQKDFVKFNFAEDSKYAKYFGDEPMYLHPDAAEMLEAIDKFARTSKTFDGAFGKFTREVLDPFTDVWKYAVTLPRPGHHIRNMVGDVTLTYLAEGGFKALAANRHAFKTMATKGTYDDVDIIRLITGSGLEMPKAGEVAVGSVKLKDGTFDFTYAQGFEDMTRMGMLPPAKGREGLRKGRGFDEEEMGDPAFARILEKGVGYVNPLARRGGGIEEVIMNIAEGRDHFVRMQHFWQIMEKAKAGKKLTAGFGRMVDPKKMTREELVTFAVNRVAKYHPDLSTLAVFERKYLKRLMPFYHWNRGAFQAVMETMVMDPARILAFPKASYNIAVASGVNPYSLYDPFPEDQMFPSFLRDEMQGPQFEVGGSYYGIRPGIVTFDVLNQVRTGNPIDAIMSNLNPAFKIPLELLIGTRIDTGARIRDYSDYIDASIPGVNYAANVSSYSVTGSLVSLLSGGGFDRQLQYEQGNKETGDQLISALNWLTGIGLVDYSRPTYIRYAQNEFRRENAPDTGRSPF